MILEEDLDDDVKLRLNKFKVIVNNLNTYGHLTKLHALSTQVSPLYTAEYCKFVADHCEFLTCKVRT